MLSTLIMKDCHLMRTYLRLALVVLVVGYLGSALFTYYVTEEFRETELRTVSARTFLALKTGLWLGVISSGLMGTLIASSIFTQERADHSVEFLSILPPSRSLHLSSKLLVTLGASVLMATVQLLVAMLLYRLEPLVRTMDPYLNHELSAPKTNTLVLWFGMTFSMISGSLAASVWFKTNGIPILIGLFTPIGIWSLRAWASQWLEVPYRSDDFQMAFASSNWLACIALIFLTCYWYLNRWEL